MVFPFARRSLKLGGCCCCLTKCHFPDVITIRSGDFFSLLVGYMYVILVLSFAFFWRIIYKFYRFFALFLSRLGRGFSDVPPLALVLRSSTASAHILYLCGVWSSCCQAFLGECYRKIQEVDCEHGANWMIRGMGLELHHHNNACVIVMTQNFGWLVYVCVWHRVGRAQYFWHFGPGCWRKWKANRNFTTHRKTPRPNQRKYIFNGHPREREKKRELRKLCS